MHLKMMLGVVALAAGSASAQFYSNAGGYGSGAIGLATGTVAKDGTVAPAGFQWSELQDDGAGVSNTSAGYTATGAFRLADDFTVPVGESWNVSRVLTYGYRTGSAASEQAITGGSINIWAGGAPNAGGSIVATGSFGSMTNTTLYRLFNSTTPAPGSPTGTLRLVREVAWDFTDLVLAAGTYWIDFQYTSPGTIFVPPITVPGSRGLPGWNAIQFTGAAWQPVVDAANPVTGDDIAQDLPFVIIPSPSAAAVLGLGGLALARRRR